MKLTTLLVCDAGLDKRQTIEEIIESKEMHIVREIAHDALMDFKNFIDTNH